jgi:cyanophycinase
MTSDATPPGAGVLLAIGGAEDKLGPKTILNRFVQLAGGRAARIAVLATASSLGDEIVDLYRRVFAELGAAEVQALRPVTREEADGDGPAAAVDRATGVFMTGGNQLRLSMVVAGTRLGAALLDAHRRGAVIGGTSAGASALSTHMVAFGGPGEVPKQRLAHMAAGLGLLPGVVVDQHFTQRNRLGRLLLLVAESPGQLGIGIDEDTAAVIGPDGVLDVVGKGTVTVVDGARAQSDAFEVRARRPVLVSGVVLHALPPGSRFDLVARKLLPRLRALPGDRRSTAGTDPSPAGNRRVARRVAAEGADDRAAGRSARRRTHDPPEQEASQ